MKKFKGLMTSLNCEWATPDYVFDKLNKEFKFDYDLCASLKNTKCKKFFEKDGCGGFLRYRQKVNHFPKMKTAFMNPPYGRKMYLFMEAAYRIHLDHNVTVVCLLPARTDTKWWHDYCLKAKEIRFIRGRLKFDGAIYNAPFPSCVVIFK